MEWMRNLSSRIAAGSRFLSLGNPVTATAAAAVSVRQHHTDRSFGGVSLLSLTAWLETQPAERPYEYTAPDRCALAQYLKGLGYEPLDSSVDFGAEPHMEDEGFWLWEIVRTQPWTFGAALDRARKAAQEAGDRAYPATVLPASLGAPWPGHV